jgi:hypothetical protein
MFVFSALIANSFHEYTILANVVIWHHASIQSAYNLEVANFQNVEIQMSRRVAGTFQSPVNLVTQMKTANHSEAVINELESHLPLAGGHRISQPRNSC